MKRLTEQTWQAEILDDEEQKDASKKIIELLGAAGYFRAFVENITNFDKIVGGMVWCITLCDVDIDVDFLYHENLTVGQKMYGGKFTVDGSNQSLFKSDDREDNSSFAKTEVSMPFGTSSHTRFELHPDSTCRSVQCTDRTAGQPSVQQKPLEKFTNPQQWLVKSAMKGHEEFKKQLLSTAAWHFDTFYRSAEKKPKRENFLNKMAEPVAEILGKNSPTRIYYRSKALSGEDELLQVRSTLFEYERHYRIKGKENVAFDTHDVEQEMPVSCFEEVQRKTEEGKAFSVNEIVQQIDFEKSPLDSGLQQVHASVLKERLERQSLKVNELNEAMKSVSEKRQHFTKQLAAAGQEKVETVRQLLQRRDILKANENDLQTFLKNFNSAAELERTAPTDLSLLLAKSLTERERLNADLVPISEQITDCLWRLDARPSQPELIQYQKRFVELYNQMSVYHSETKRYFDFFNFLQDMKWYTENEISLLDSTSSNFPALQIEDQRQELFSQMHKSFDSIKRTRVTLENSVLNERLKNSHLKKSYQEVLDQQRYYFKMVKDLLEECRKNDVLTKEVESVK